MKKTITLLIFFLSINSCVNSQTFSWANKFDFSDYNLGLSLSLDASGNSYIGGHYFATGSPGPITESSGAFIAKFNGSGNMIWSDTVNGSDDYGQKVCVDPSGNVYLGTFVTATRIVGGTAVSSAGSRDALIAKYNSSGTLLWARTAGGTGRDVVQGIGTDASGNVYIAGYFGNTASFGGFSLTASGTADIFVAKYSSDGTCLWAEKAGGDADTVTGIGFDQALSLSVDNAGNAYLSGYYIDAATFGSTTLTSLGNRDAFIAKINNSGTWDWASKVGGGTASPASAVAIAIDNAGKSYVAGSFSGSVMFEGSTLSSAGGTDVYLAKFDNSGNMLWVHKGGGADDDVAYAVSVDASGDPYVTGSYTDNLTIGDTSFTIAGEENTFIAKYDASGTFDWAKQIKAHTGQWEFVTGYGMDIDATKNVFVTGEFFAAAIFDGITLTATKPAHAFIAKLNTSISAGVNTNTDKASLFNVFYEGNNIIKLTYETDQQTELQFQIMNVMGQCVYSENNIKVNGNGSKSINLSSIAKGVYFVNMITKEKRNAYKLIINE